MFVTVVQQQGWIVRWMKRIPDKVQCPPPVEDMVFHRRYNIFQDACCSFGEAGWIVLQSMEHSSDKVLCPHLVVHTGIHMKYNGAERLFYSSQSCSPSQVCIISSNFLRTPSGRSQP